MCPLALTDECCQVHAVVMVTEEGERLARRLRRSGFGLMVAFSMPVALFVVGETVNDPGGWAAVGMIGSWAIPLVSLVALALYRPTIAARLLATLVAAVIGMSVWFALDTGAWRSFEDERGPARAIATFALAAVTATLGLKRTGLAGWLLLAVTVVPVVVSGVGAGTDGGFVTLTVVSVVPFLTGTLYVLSAAAEHRAPRSRTHAATERPKVARRGRRRFA